MMIGLGINFWVNFFFILLKNEIFVEFEFVILIIIKLIFFLFSILGVFMVYNINFVVNLLIFVLKISIFGNWLYCFLNKCWFFDKIFNDFIFRFFLCFGYEVLFKVLDKGVIEILGFYGILYIFWKLVK